MAKKKPTAPLGVWKSMSREGAPAPRIHHGGVWTGKEMIVWGGTNLGAEGKGWLPLCDGARYDPARDRWTKMSEEGAPPARRGPVMLWTGKHLLVCAGRYEEEHASKTGADFAAFKCAFLYDPEEDRWSKAPGLEIYPREIAAVWTGEEAILWAGASGSYYLESGVRYDPYSGQMKVLPRHAGNCNRVFHTAVFTGKEMIIWGGFNGSPRGGGRRDGQAYDPKTDSWREISSEGAPSAREFHTAVFTGKEMIVFSGRAGAKPPAGGGRYDPAQDRWTPLEKSSSSPAGREMHCAVFGGARMLVWGGVARLPPTYENSYPEGGAFDPQTGLWSPLGEGEAPGASNASAVFTGEELLVFGGNIAVEQGRSVFTDRGFRLRLEAHL